MRNEDLKLILDTQFSAVRATIMAESEVQNTKIDAIVKHQRIQNGKLEKHHLAIDDLERCNSSRMAVGKFKGRAFVIGCSILATAGTVITILLSIR